MLKFFKKFFTRRKEPSTTKHVAKTPQLSEKEIATKRKEPWVDVIKFNVNKENIRYGFYELDWNEYFIMELKEKNMDSTVIQMKKSFQDGLETYA